jgi:hypothetical protein
MPQNLTYDIDSAGGGMGGLGGLGGGGSLPLWLLLFLGIGGKDGGLFGGGGNQAAGFVAGENTSKLDCLTQGQNNLADQLRQQTDNFRFDGLNNQISELAGIARDGQAAAAANANDLARQLAECCCDLKVGQQATQTAIAMQTNDLVTNATANTQRLVDLITANSIEAKNDRISELERQSQTSTLAAIIRDQCGEKQCNSGGNNIDINVLAAAIANGQRAQVAA